MNEPVRRVIPGHVDVPGADIRGSQRASDAERTRVIRHLAGCHADGRIPGDVFTARMEAAAECVTQAELLALLDDLPAMMAPRRKIVARVRGWRPGVTGRRVAHTVAGVLALCWMIIPGVLIFTATGYPVTYKSGVVTWSQIEHPGVALMFVWLFVITGLVALVWDLVWWARWELSE